MKEPAPKPTEAQVVDRPPPRPDGSSCSHSAPSSSYCCWWWRCTSLAARTAPACTGDDEPRAPEAHADGPRGQLRWLARRDRGLPRPERARTGQRRRAIHPRGVSDDGCRRTDGELMSRGAAAALRAWHTSKARTRYLVVRFGQPQMSGSRRRGVGSAALLPGTAGRPLPRAGRPAVVFT